MTREEAKALVPGDVLFNTWTGFAYVVETVDDHYVYCASPLGKLQHDHCFMKDCIRVPSPRIYRVSFQ